MRKALRRGLRGAGERAITALSRIPGIAGLKIVPGNAGFFGEVFCALNGLRIAERRGLYAQMDWGPNSLYYEATYATGGDAWASFFSRAKFDFRKNTDVRTPVFSVPFKPGAEDFEPYDGLSTRRSLGKALHAWCNPHPDIAAEADSVWSNASEGREMLGLHIRLTDAAAGAEQRKSVAMEHFFEATDDWIKGRPQAGIFLATDESRVISAFEERYGARVAYQDCLRSHDGTSIHGHYDAGVAGSPYQKGREVLIDALLLARCAYLIRTHSRVTAFSLCWAPELSYRDLEIEVTGVNRTPWLHDPAT